MQRQASSLAADDGIRRAQRQLSFVRGLLCALAAIAAVGGLLAGFLHFDALASFGFSRATILAAILFAALAYYTGQRSRIALALALALLLLDTALLIYASVGHFSLPIMAALVLRLLLAVLIARGFGAMRRLDDAHAAMTRRLLAAFTTARSLASAASSVEARLDSPISAIRGTVEDELQAVPSSLKEAEDAQPNAEPSVKVGIDADVAEVVCPKCGHRQWGGDTCLSCGVIFEQYRSAWRRVRELEAKLGRLRL